MLPHVFFHLNVTENIIPDYKQISSQLYNQCTMFKINKLLQFRMLFPAPDSH